MSNEKFECSKCKNKKLKYLGLNQNGPLFNHIYFCKKCFSKGKDPITIFKKGRYTMDHFTEHIHDFKIIYENPHGNWVKCKICGLEEIIKRSEKN